MKKTLLLFVLLISFIGNAQINSQVTDYAVCDPNNDGVAVFDLTSKIPEILNTLNPAIHVTTFHETMTDAQMGSGTIENASAYLNITPWNQTIYVRVVNTQTSEVSLTSFQITTFGTPNANPASLFFCDPFELAIYNLNMSIPQIVNDPTVLSFTYYLSEADALNGINAVSGDFFVPTVVPVQVLFVRVENTVTGCFRITTLTLNTNNCTSPPTCDGPTNVTVSAITSTSAVVNWLSQGPLSQVLVLPFGSPTPTESTAGWVYTQANPFVLTGLSSDACYSVYVRSFCPNTNAVVSQWSVAADFCMHDCSNNAQCPESLELIAFIDSNNNGTKDVGEMNFTEGHFVYDINDSGNPVYASSNNGDFYIFENNPANSYDLSFAVNPALGAYFSSSSVYNNITVPAGSGSTSYYFPITQLQPYNDLEIHLVPGGNPRPGFTYTNTIYYKNKGFQTVNSGTVTFIKSAIVSITNISQSVTSIPTGFNYAFTNLAPNETRYITVTMQVPTIPTVSLGDVVTNTASIEPIAGDAFPIDNTVSLSQTIVGSYDPNDKMEAHGEKILIDNFSSNDYLTYTIRFENTGTADAEFIRVEDTLNTALNASSVIILDASHSVDVRRINNKLIWNFYNINLPPTVNNPASSHGYVRFKVKPNTGYEVGDIIPNRAEIYFDYNPPILTNRFETEFVDVLGNLGFEGSNFILFPNPAQSTFQAVLQNSNENIQNISIINVLGKTIKSIKNISSNETNVDVSDLPNGIYLVEIITESNLKMTKKLVIN